MNDRRLRRLEEQIKERIALVVLRDLQDPRLGFLTITRVELDRELEHCNVYWSVLGDEAARRLQQQMLDHANKFVRHEVAAILRTRTVPRLHFVFDERVEGALRVQKLIDKLKAERATHDPEAKKPE